MKYSLIIQHTTKGIVCIRGEWACSFWGEVITKYLYVDYEGLIGKRRI